MQFGTRRIAISGTEMGESLRAALLAAFAAAAILWLAPPPGDAAAHLYRTWLVERGVVFWDNLWFGGNYPIFTYSPLYYFLAAIVGNVALTVAGCLIAAACFAALAVREWGPAAAWPARVFGVCAAGPLMTGTALAFSALAFFFLALAVGAVVLARRCTFRTALLAGACAVALVAVWAALELFLPSAGRYPYSWWSLLAAGGTSACGIVLARHARSASLLVAFFALWLASCLVLYLLPSPMGETVTRLRYVIFPLILLTVLLGGTRPRWLAVIALAGAATYNVVPYIVGLVERAGGDGTASEQSYWQPTIDFLGRNESPNYLVEVVATGAHWESYYLPKAGIPVVRGWLRQTDIARNNILYERSARPADYLQWLHANAVRYVVLPDVRLDAYTGDRERQLVRAAATGLVLVKHTDHVTIYAVPRPTPLMTGPGRARITALTHVEVRGVVAAPGMYELRLSWSPYWRVENGSMTLHKDANGQVVVEASEPGPFTIDVEAPSPF